MKTKLNGILTLLLALVVQVAFAQQAITGKVVDVSGEGLFGATVQIKGTNTGVTTDFDGNYTITASSEQTLVFSSTGYTGKEVQVGSQRVINVTLSASLDAVVVNSYRTTTSEKSTVASSTITSETIENRPNASFVQTLTGQVAGLNIFTNSGQPGANSTVNLRGVGSINGNTEPLFVMDGSPIDEDNFRSLNPQDIESITILKDAGATAIYGNRGANGVIVITTRKGRKGALRINATSISSFTNLQDNDYNLYNSQELLTLERSRGVGAGANGFARNPNDPTAGVPLTDAQIASAINTDWTDVFFRTGVATNNTVTLQSGSENASQYTSIGFFDQEGVLVDSDLKRFTFRNNLTGSSKNGRFNYATNLSVNYSKSNEPNSIGTGGINRNFVLGAFQSVPYLNPDDYSTDLINNDILPNALNFADTPFFLLSVLDKQKRFEEEVKSVGSLNFSYKLTDHITARSISGVDYTNTILTFAQESDGFNAQLFGGGANPFAGFQDQQTTRQFTFNQITSLSYNNTFAEKHTVDVGLYTEYFKAHLRTFGFRAQGLDPRTFAYGDGSGFVADAGAANDFFIDLANANIAESGIFSYFASADYDYDSKYGLSLTYRRDASSRFSSTNRWGTFYSVAARWNIHQEDFWGDSNPINVLKIRGSYGRTGNQDIVGAGYFGGLTLINDLYATGNGYANAPGLFPSTFANSDLRWETTIQYNVGVDFEVWNSRLRGAIDVYYRDTDDLFQSAPISGTAGTGGYALNANFGLLTNKGIDLDLKYDIVRPGAQNPDGLRINVGFVGNFNESIIRDLPTEDGVVIGVGREGGRLGEYFTVRHVGVNPANGNLLFLDINGNLTESPNDDSDRVWLNKNITPEFQGGFTFNVDYKNFFFTSQFQYNTGIDRFDNDLAGFQDITSLGQFNLSRDLNRAWTPDNRVTDIASFDATNINTFADDQYLREADFVRLRFLQLGYGFDASVLEKFNIATLKLFMNAENLVTFSKWRGFDAAVLSNTSRLYPTPRIVSLGVEIGI